MVVVPPLPLDCCALPTLRNSAMESSQRWISAKASPRETCSVIGSAQTKEASNQTARAGRTAARGATTMSRGALVNVEGRWYVVNTEKEAEGLVTAPKPAADPAGLLQDRLGSASAAPAHGEPGVHRPCASAIIVPELIQTSREGNFAPESVCSRPVSRTCLKTADTAVRILVFDFFKK